MYASPALVRNSRTCDSRRKRSSGFGAALTELSTCSARRSYTFASRAKNSPAGDGVSCCS
jgi:hypothetical protein